MLLLHSRGSARQLCSDARGARVVRCGHGLLAISSVRTLHPGDLLTIGTSSALAATLFSRAGLYFAAPLTPCGTRVARPSSSPPGTPLYPTSRSLTLSVDPSSLGGTTIDWAGSPLSHNARSVAGRSQPVFSAAPLQAELKPIDRSLHTGTLAIDALTPVGRGQTMLLIGGEASGKQGVVYDAMLAQARSDVRCVLALPQAEAPPSALRVLEDDSGVREKTTVLTLPRRAADPMSAPSDKEGGRGSSVEEGAGKLPAVSSLSTPPEEEGGGSTRLAEGVLTIASALSVGEMVRDCGGHALVVLDDLTPLLAAWDAAGELLHAAGTSALGDHTSSEQRIFFASFLQRAAQLSDAKGCGSLSTLALLPKPRGRGGEEVYELQDFAKHSASHRARVGALHARGVPLLGASLAKIGIPPPSKQPFDSLTLHADQLKSLADGHVYLHDELSQMGKLPAIRAEECIGRVGAGSDINTRPQPMSSAMSQVCPSLRLELSQALDIHPTSHDAYSRAQLVRARSAEALLHSQPPGRPLRLTEELVLLHALLEGRLDHFAQSTPAQVRARVISLLEGVAAALGDDTLDAIDETGTLDHATKARLHSAIAEQLPNATGRAFFTSYDKSTWQ